MLLENISLGKTLEIYVDREGYRYRLVSKVEGTSVRRVCVTAITANGKAFLFRPEDEIRLVYRDEEQMWEWTNVKAGLAKLDGSPVHYFDIRNRGRSFNRRNAYRVSVDEDAEIGYYDIPESYLKSALMPLVREEYEVIIDSDGHETEIEEAETGKNGTVTIEKRVRTVPMIDAVPHKIQVHIKDISETGMGIFSNTRLNIDDGFFIGIPSDYGTLMTKAVVVRTSETKSRNGRYQYYYGCVYTESDKKLIKYIYDIQRKQIKKHREKRDFEATMRNMRKTEKVIENQKKS